MANKPLDWQDVLTFGKHEGKTLGQVFDEDRGYIEWLINETNHRVAAHVADAVDSVDDDNYWGDHP